VDVGAKSSPGQGLPVSLSLSLLMVKLINYFDLVFVTN